MVVGPSALTALMCRRACRYPITPYIAGGGAVIAGVLGAAALLPAATAAHVIGLTGCTCAVLLMSSPLAVIRTIIKEKNTSAMPFATSLATFLNALSWSSYGYLVAQDAMIWAPNMMGLASACVQMALFVKYPAQPADSNAPTNSES